MSPSQARYNEALTQSCAVFFSTGKSPSISGGEGSFQVVCPCGLILYLAMSLFTVSVLDLLEIFLQQKFAKPPPLSFISDQALPGFGGGGRPSGRGEDGDGGDTAVRLDRQAATKADMERQVTQRTADFVPFIGPQQISGKVRQSVNNVHRLIVSNENTHSKLLGMKQFIVVVWE